MLTTPQKPRPAFRQTPLRPAPKLAPPLPEDADEVRPSVEVKEPRCPKCNAPKPHKYRSTGIDGERKQYALCRHCGQKFFIVVR